MAATHDAEEKRKREKNPSIRTCCLWIKREKVKETVEGF